MPCGTDNCELKGRIGGARSTNMLNWSKIVPDDALPCCARNAALYAGEYREVNHPRAATRATLGPKPGPIGRIRVNLALSSGPHVTKFLPNAVQCGVGQNRPNSVELAPKFVECARCLAGVVPNDAKVGSNLTKGGAASM